MDRQRAVKTRRNIRDTKRTIKLIYKSCTKWTRIKHNPSNFPTLPRCWIPKVIVVLRIPMPTMLVGKQLILSLATLDTKLICDS